MFYSHLPREIDELRERLYRAGHSDGQIAKLTGCAKESIAAWRRRRRYPANYSIGAKGVSKVELRRKYQSIEVIA